MITKYIDWTRIKIDAPNPDSENPLDNYWIVGVDNGTEYYSHIQPSEPTLYEIAEIIKIANEN